MCVNLCVADLPDPPRFPQVENIFHDSVLMTWKPPLNDGGSFISQYIVEKCEPPGENWVRCAVTRSVHCDEDRQLHQVLAALLETRPQPGLNVK